MPAENVTTTTATTSTTKSENRRSNKPLMEKRRRARINSSLGELKNLILTAMKKDASRSSKLEKADILEMAVKHLQNLQNQQQQQQQRSTPGTTTGNNTIEGVDIKPELQNTQNKFRAGYNECAVEVSRYLDTVDVLDATVRNKLVGHLHRRFDHRLHSDSVTNDDENNDWKSQGVVKNDINNVTAMDYSINNSERSSISTESSCSSSSRTSSGTLSSWSSSGASSLPGVVESTQDHIHIPATSIPLSLLSNEASPPVVRGSFAGLRLVPTRLSTGEFAFVVPHAYSVQTATSGLKEEPVWRPW